MYENFYYLSVKRFFDIRKREAQSFYDDVSICPKPYAAPAARPQWALKVNLLLRTAKLNSLLFLILQKSSAQASSARCHSHPPIWDFYFDISEWHILPAHASTPILWCLNMGVIWLHIYLTDRCIYICKFDDHILVYRCMCIG